MATIGSVLTNPESGWKRIEETDPNFTYEGTWGSRSNSAYSGGSQKTQSNKVLNNKIKFKFYGTKIRIITSLYPSYTPKAKVTIDGIEEYYSLQGNANIALAYEKTNLPLGLHYVEIEKMTNDGYDPDFIWDAIDIDYNGYIASKDFSIKRLAIKDQTTGEHYSLSDNTLTHLPDNSTKNMILHGIEQGKKIQLDVPFDKHRYFNDTPVANVSGKVFTHDIGKINTLNIKELRENKDFEPLYIWHNTNMTSNNTPTRLVASASSEYNSTYTAWKAFNGTVTDSNDRWRSSDYTVNQWIKLDYGIIKRVNVVKIQGVTDSTILAGNPIEYIIEGSNDDSNWNIITNISTTAFADKETKSFFFNEVSYRYYKLTPTRNQGNVSYFNIGDIVFGYKREVK